MRKGKRLNYVHGIYREVGDFSYNSLAWLRGPIAAFKIKRRRVGDFSPIQYRERFALFVEGFGYLYYRNQTHGINLIAYGMTPKYEWMIKSERHSSGSVDGRKGFGLYNTIQRDHLVYCKREYGINLKWSRKCTRRR